MPDISDPMFWFLIGFLERFACAYAGRRAMIDRGYCPGIGIGVGAIFGLIGLIALFCVPPRGWKPEDTGDGR